MELSKSAERTIEELTKLGIIVENLGAELKLLLYGVKPAAIVTMHTKTVQVFMKHYPSITRPGLNQAGSVIIFKDADVMSCYTEDAHVIEHPKTGEKMFRIHSRLLGIFMGYPPSACEWFTSRPIQEALKHNHNVDNEECCFIYYHGIQFATHKDLVKENIEWLRAHRPVPEAAKDFASIQVPYYVDQTGKVTRKVVAFDDYLKNY
ncbi:hypothetical protein MCCARTNEY_258 [Bacillus phage vB_BanH_McCartney]|nr:hypothetical protein MCCARTNEY_258 [Bacillus phage vB_BanH_McCartney]